MHKHTNLLTRQGGNNDVAFSNQGVHVMSLIGPEDPEYLEMFAASFGAGQSYPARLVKKYPPLVPGPESPEQEQDPGREQQGDPQPGKS